MEKRTARVCLPIFIVLCSSVLNCSILSQPQLSGNYAREPNVKVRFFQESNWRTPGGIEAENIVPSEPLDALLDGDVVSSVTFRFPKKYRYYADDIAISNSIHEIGGMSIVGCVMSLPSEQEIEQLVIHANRLEQFDVQIKPEGQISWHTHARIRNNRDEKVVVNLSTSAKHIRISARSDYHLSDDGSVCIDGKTLKTYASAPVTICEVELYGWAN